MREREPGLLLQGFGQGAKSSDKRLEIALEKALRWQTTLVDDTEVKQNGHTYTGPHKWIVCLIGSDAYSVGTFTG